MDADAADGMVYLQDKSDLNLCEQAKVVLGHPRGMKRDELIEKIQAFVHMTTRHAVKRHKGNERRIPIRCTCKGCYAERRRTQLLLVDAALLA